MTRRIAVFVSLSVALACAHASAVRWSGEAKNSIARLTADERHAFETRSAQLRKSAHSIESSLRALALALNDSNADLNERQRLADATASALADIVRREAEIRSILFTTGDYLAAATAVRRGLVVDSETDIRTEEPGLRDQIGFFPEAPTKRIEDLGGYPKNQFAVSTAASKMRIRVPVVVGGSYLGDLVAEYCAKE